MKRDEEAAIAEILSRLPIKSIIRFTSTCKSWRDTIAAPSFSLLRAKKKNNTSYAFFSTTPSSSESSVFEVGPIGAPAKTASRKLDRGSGLLIAGSCNGLLCLVDRRPMYDNITLFNPVTNESVRVNAPAYDAGRPEARYMFGYGPSTNEYKVLCCAGDEYEIITVGVDKGWRKLPRALFPGHVRPHGRPPVVSSCNGALYWLAGDSDFDLSQDFILVFDIAREVVSRIPIPRTNLRHLRLLVCEEPLCLYYRIGGRHVVWSRDGDSGSWGPVRVPNCAFMGGGYEVDFDASLDGGFLFRVGGSDASVLYCPKSGKYSAMWFPHGVKKLCWFTPNFSSIEEIVGRPRDVGDDEWLFVNV